MMIYFCLNANNPRGYTLINEWEITKCEIISVQFPYWETPLSKYKEFQVLQLKPNEVI